MSGEIVKDLKRGGRDVMEVLSRYIPGGTEENNDKVSQDRLCSGLVMNGAPLEYGTIALPLWQPLRLRHLHSDFSLVHPGKY
jgi:hypothetical protein